MEKKKLESNIKKIFWLNGAFSFLVLMPIIVPFFQHRGLNMQNVYELQAIFGLVVLICEVPSGYFSDLVGRKVTLMIASVLHSLGFLIMALSSDFYTLVVSELVLGVSISLYSGTDSSLMYDSLHALGKKTSGIKSMGQKVFYAQVGESFAGLVGGWLLLVHFEAPAIAQTMVGMVPLCIAATLYEPARSKMQGKNHGDNFRYVLKSLFRHSKLLNLIIFTGMFYGFASLVAVWIFQDYWKELGYPLTSFGYLWFAINIAVGITGRYAHKIEKKWGSEFVLILIGILPILGFFGMSFTVALWGALFCLTFQICRGLNSVIIADALNKRVTGDMRATANSIMSLGMRGLMITVGPMVGAMVDSQGQSTALSFLGWIYVTVFIVILLPFLMLRKEFAPIPQKGS